MRTIAVRYGHAVARTTALTKHSNAADVDRPKSTPPSRRREKLAPDFLTPIILITDTTTKITTHILLGTVQSRGSATPPASSNRGRKAAPIPSKDAVRSMFKYRRASAETAESLLPNTTTIEEKPAIAIATSITTIRIDECSVRHLTFVSTSQRLSRNDRFTIIVRSNDSKKNLLNQATRSLIQNRRFWKCVSATPIPISRFCCSRLINKKIC